MSSLIKSITKSIPVGSYGLFLALLMLAPTISQPGNAAPVSGGLFSSNGPAGASLITPVAVFGKDNRRFLARKKSPISNKIGLLYNQRTRTLCTAFCLSKSIIGTAAHCLFSKAGRRRQKIRDFTFSIDHRKRSTSSRIAGARIGAADQHVIAGSTRLRVRPPIDATSDWALVRLEKPVCRSGGLEISPIRVSKLIDDAKSRKFFQIAYHRDLKKWQLAHSQPCKVSRQFGKYRWNVVKRDFSRSGNLILHRCDTGGASSGSPLILDTKSGPRIVGINVGTYIQSKILMRNGRVTKRFKARTVANTGVSVLAFSNLVDHLKHATIITRPGPMRQLQTELRNRTLYAGPIDGTYGYLTRAAITQYEKNVNWPVTGLPTAALLKHFQDANLLSTAGVASGTTKVETGGLSQSADKY